MSSNVSKQNKGMTTCKVCGRDFALIAEEHYIARDTDVIGVIPALSGTKEPVQWDTFDCPHCGCQNVMQERKAALAEDNECPCDFGICDECDHAGQNNTEVHDGCVGCTYENMPVCNYPCNECKGNYKDLYKRRTENE